MHQLMLGFIIAPIALSSYALWQTWKVKKVFLEAKENLRNLLSSSPQITRESSSVYFYKSHRIIVGSSPNELTLRCLFADPLKQWISISSRTEKSLIETDLPDPSFSSLFQLQSPLDKETGIMLNMNNRRILSEFVQKHRACRLSLKFDEVKMNLKFNNSTKETLEINSELLDFFLYLIDLVLAIQSTDLSNFQQAISMEGNKKMRELMLNLYMKDSSPKDDEFLLERMQQGHDVAFIGAKLGEAAIPILIQLLQQGFPAEKILPVLQYKSLKDHKKTLIDLYKKAVTTAEQRSYVRLFATTGFEEILPLLFENYKLRTSLDERNEILYCINALASRDSLPNLFELKSISRGENLKTLNRVIAQISGKGSKLEAGSLSLDSFDSSTLRVEGALSNVKDENLSNDR
jgi:hypothetical protein